MKTIVELRKERGWSQHELAVKLGVTAATVYNWERGKNEPNVSTFRRLARILGVSMDEIALVGEQQAEQGQDKAAA